GGAPAASRRAHAPRRRGPPAATRDRPADAARLPDHHRLPRSKEALDDLVRDGRATRVEGIAGKWYAYAPLPGERFRPRTTLLCPFDKLIADRDRTEAPFGFRYRLEIYVPKAKREYGYYVLPILHGERLAGRIDPLFERKTGV